MSRCRSLSSVRHRCAASVAGVASVILPIAALTAQTPVGGETVAVQSSTTSNLNINPKRLTFDRLGKSAAIFVFNQGRDATAFDVQLVDRLMLPNGQIIPFSEAGARPELKPLPA